ncbi:hypothetical protein C7U61_02415 [Rhizobium sp. JAB6]|nr:hypothetical protein C7U61_02415 [Rhizobium sp. JAB6]
MNTKISHVVYGGTPNPPSSNAVSIDGSITHTKSWSLTDYFPEKAEDKIKVRDVADYMEVIVKDKKSGELIDCVISKPNELGHFYTIGFSKSRPEGARGPVGKFDTPKECSGRFTSIQEAQQVLRNWIENSTSSVELFDVDRKYNNIR